ncbi:MAG: oligosaccharide flippase family protein [Lachnospiraceae bacterium]|nr:oligosaccharide flippase family protein [Lachnospiraceae bacterium]
MGGMTVNDTTSKLKWGIFWNVFGSVGSKVLVMLASILTARILGADRNGEFGMINNTVGMFSTFAALGLGTTATRFVVEFKENKKERCGNVIAMAFFIALASSLIFAGGLILGSDWLAENTLNNSKLSIGLKLSTIMLLFNTLNTIQNSILAGFEDFKIVARVAIIQGIISVPVFVVFTLLFGVNGLVIGYGIVGIITFLIANLYIKRACKKNHIFITYKTCLSEYRLLFKFALPAMLMNVVVIPVTWLGNTIVIQDFNGYYHLGVFNAANQWRSAISLLPAAIGNVILPFIITRDDDTVEDVNILLSWFIVLVLSSGVTFLSGLITLFYGRSYDYTSLNRSIIVICAICGFLAFKEGIARNLIKHSYMWFGFFSNLLWGICFIICILIFKQWGAIGISCAYLLAYFITTVIFVPFYIKEKIVDKKYFLNKTILAIWAVFIVYLVVSLIFDNIWVKGILFLAMMFMVYWGCEIFFGISGKVLAVLTRKKNS